MVASSSIKHVLFEDTDHEGSDYGLRDNWVAHVGMYDGLETLILLLISNLSLKNNLRIECIWREDVAWVNEEV